jgi:acyl carrier protein
MTEQAAGSVDAESIKAESIKDVLIAFIADDLGWEGDVVSLLADPPAVLPEALDSQDLLELSGFIEFQYGIEILDEEINAENMGTLPALVGFVQHKIAGAA